MKTVPARASKNTTRHEMPFLVGSIKLGTGWHSKTESLLVSVRRTLVVLLDSPQ